MTIPIDKNPAIVMGYAAATVAFERAGFEAFLQVAKDCRGDEDADMLGAMERCSAAANALSAYRALAAELPEDRRAAFMESVATDTNTLREVDRKRQAQAQHEAQERRQAAG